MFSLLFIIVYKVGSKSRPSIDLEEIIIKSKWMMLII